jgi:hypothetical protein
VKIRSRAMQVLIVGSGTLEENMRRQRQIAAVISILLAIASCPPAQAQQVYKCVKDGKTSFQATPCDGGSTSTAQPRPATGGGLPWDGIRLGMSADDVKRTIAGVRAEGDAVASGDQLRLRKQGVIIAGIPFDATYSFDRAGRLSSVYVEKTGDVRIGLLNINANDANLADYGKLTSYFRTKYGAETSSTMKNKETGFPGLSAGSYWSVEGARVFVSVSPLTATTSMLSLGYQSERK